MVWCTTMISVNKTEMNWLSVISLVVKILSSAKLTAHASVSRVERISQPHAPGGEDLTASMHWVERISQLDWFGHTQLTFTITL